MTSSPGKPKKQTVCGYVHTSLKIAYGVLKNRTPFDPDWTAKKST